MFRPTKHVSISALISDIVQSQILVDIFNVSMEQSCEEKQEHCPDRTL